MASESRSALKNALHHYLRRLKTKQERLENRSSRLSFIRFIYFIAFIILVYFAAQLGNTVIFGTILILGTGLFVGLVKYHQKLEQALARLKKMKQLRAMHFARMTLDWENITPRHPIDKPAGHPFAGDFNITGPNGLLHLINATTYAGSAKTLRNWLLSTSLDETIITERQALIKELKPMAHFRDRLSMHATSTQQKESPSDWSASQLLQFLKSTPEKSFTTALGILGTLSLVNIILFALYMAGSIGPYVFFTFAAYLIAYNFLSETISGLFEEANQLKKVLGRFNRVLKYLEKFPYKKDSALATFTAPFHKGKQRPSHYVKKIVRIASAAASQNSEIVWALLNLVVPWDVYFAHKLHTYKKELSPQLETWLETFYELEALTSLANFAWLNPGYTFQLPEQSANQPVVSARQLGHPLIKHGQKVCNDVTINAVGDIHLITGSNMAGKSTYLRTVGINLALCFAGAPVNAQALKTPLFRLFSSINVTDSLDEGLSHFYAEVTRLRELLDELERSHDIPLFFMVDEIYRGTNNRERLRGSEAFLTHVAGKNGIGLVTTHDLELAQLENEIPVLSNWHFAETIKNKKMHFEYTLNKGPCPSTNALKIMDIEGLPIT